MEGNLTPVEEVKPLTDLVEIVKVLSDGKVLRLDKGTTSSDGTVLLRLGRGKVPLTEITKDIKKESAFFTRYWIPYNVAINTLLTYNVYIEEEYQDKQSKFIIGDKVKYYPLPDKEVEDLALVTEVLMDDAQNFYYKLSNDSYIYQESSLQSIDK